LDSNCIPSIQAFGDNACEDLFDPQDHRVINIGKEPLGVVERIVIRVVLLINMMNGKGEEMVQCAIRGRSRCFILGEVICSFH